MEAILLLPRPLLDQGAGVEVTGRIDRLLAEKNLSVVKTSALLEALQISSLGNGKISAGVCSQIGSFLDKLDIGFEPDRRFSGRNLSADGHAVLFRALGGGGVDPESPAYQAARSMTEIAALAALSDGQLDPAEYESIKSDIRALAGLGPHEMNRLVAYAIALLKDAPAQQATLNKLKLLDSGAKETVLKSATAAVLADGRTTPEEVRFLERLHKSLGEPTDAVYAALHKGRVVVDQPVTIAPETRASGVPIPAQPEAQAKPSGVRLDQDKIDRIREETLAVSGMLADIFKEDEPLRPAPKPASYTPPSGKFGGLDPQHAGLLEKLLNQPSMTRAQFDDTARASRLLPDGALETINEWAFEKFGEPLVEGDDTLTLAPHLIPELMEPA
jgi:tellurite resistance protein